MSVPRHIVKRTTPRCGPSGRFAGPAAESHFAGHAGARVHALVRGGHARGPTVCFVHGNLSSARFFEPVLASLPGTWHVVAPDLRGFGRSDPVPVDATRGLADFVDDVDAVLSDAALAPTDRPVHLVGWSMGGGVAMAYAIEHPEKVASITLLAPLSPFGFGGTKGIDGAPCHEDGAGTGAGTVAPELVRRLREGDRSDESDFSPRSILRTLYLGVASKLSPALEDLLVEEILLAAVGDDHYPGTHRDSSHWPGVAPGTRGVANTMSPLYCNLSAFVGVAAVRPVLWVRGSDDLIVSDHSMLDLGHLGALGVVAGWPGPEVFPAQPMVSQTEALLQRAEMRGGTVVEAVLQGCGHAPHLEDEEHVLEVLVPFVGSAERSRR